MLLKVLHISGNPNLPNVLTPRQPQSESTAPPSDDGLDSLFTENLPLRVSFGFTIQECILATYANFSDEFERVKNPLPYKDFYVYGAYIDDNHGVISKYEMKRNLHDYHVTREIAVTKPVKIFHVGKIRFYNDEPNSVDVYYYPYDDPKNGKFYAAPMARYKILSWTNKDFDLEAKAPYVFKERKK